ncbi:MAG TPA: hypothetical protein DEB24_06370 [Coriobacteriia bacterium]|nr:hypothetical protein [Coriobacteriia bacterium]
MTGSFNKKRKRITDVPLIEREQIYIIQKPESIEQRRLPDIGDRSFKIGAIIVIAIIVVLTIIAVTTLL